MRAFLLSKGNHKMNDAIKEIYQTLMSKYNKSAISKQELADELGISIHTINYYITKGINLPNYKKLQGSGNGGKVMFPLNEVAKYLSQTNLTA